MILDWILSILLNLIPLFIFALPLLILKKNTIKRAIYSRIFYALIIFFLVYWILPSLFQYTASNLPMHPEDEGNIQLGFFFILSRTFSLFLLFAQYPFVLLPFVFIFAPAISFILLMRKLKSESGTIIEKVNQLSYDLKESPKEMILNAFKVPDWKREKEIFKAFLILLPISLYLLTVVLDIAGLEPVNIAESETALGWFIEILFVYIATFLSGFQLLAVSQISFKGRFVGEQLQSRFFESLTQVGTPIAVLSLLLFIAQKTQSMPLIIYFFAYFLMAAVIYVMLMRIFEPISIIILIKIVNWWKMKNIVKKKTNKEEFQNSSIIIFLGFIGSLITIAVGFGSQLLLSYLSEQIPNGSNFFELSLINEQPDFYIAQLTENLSIIGSIMVILFTIILGFFFFHSLNNNRNIGKTILIYGAILTGVTIMIYLITGLQMPLLFFGDLGWITGAPVITNVFGFNFITMRTAFLQSTFSLENPVLLLLAFPFLIFRQFANFALWGIMFYFLKKKFMSINFVKEENKVEKVTFSSESIILFNEFQQIPKIYLTLKDGPNFQLSGLSEQNQKIMNSIRRGCILSSIFSSEQLSQTELIDCYKFLKQITLIHKQLIWWRPEFSYEYERAQLDGLYLLYIDGRDMLYYNFNKVQETTVDPGLVSGMFSAITTFIQETTRSSDLLRTIDQGEKKVILEYSEKLPIFGALFSSKESIEIRTALKNMINEFATKHRRVLENWSGNMDYFKEDHKIVEKHFNEFI